MKGYFAPHIMTTVIRVIVLRTPLAGVPLSETHPGPGAPNDLWGLMAGKPLVWCGWVSLMVVFEDGCFRCLGFDGVFVMFDCDDYV